MGCDGPRCELTRGLAGDFSFQVLDRDGNEYTSLTTPFLATDTLSCDIWTGDDQAALATITPTWLDADLAQYQVSFAASDSTDWEIGDYQGIVTATRSGRTGPIGRFTLSVKAAPGSATEAVCFTTYQDLLLYAPWIGEVQACADQARFQEQQSRATTRLIDALCQRWKTQVVWDISRTTLVAWGTGVEPSDWLRQQLVPLTPDIATPATLPDRETTAASFHDPRISTALIVRDEVREVCARWAIGAVLEAQVGRNADKDWRALARVHYRQADSLFRATRFAIDMTTPPDGYPEFWIDGGATSLR